MDQLLLILAVALIVGAVVFGVAVLITGADPGMEPVEPDGRAVPLPGHRPLVEEDVTRVRFDTALRGYRMGQVDRVLRRAAYDIGYKDELITVLEAEVAALRSGRTEDAEVLRRAREAALAGPVPDPVQTREPAGERVVDLGLVPPAEPDAEPAASEPVAAEPVAAEPAVAEPAGPVAAEPAELPSASGSADESTMDDDALSGRR